MVAEASDVHTLGCKGQRQVGWYGLIANIPVVMGSR